MLEVFRRGRGGDRNGTKVLRGRSDGTRGSGTTISSSLSLAAGGGDYGRIRGRRGECEREDDGGTSDWCLSLPSPTNSTGEAGEALVGLARAE